MVSYDFLVVSGFLISGGSDALGVLGLRPGFGISVWGFCGFGGVSWVRWACSGFVRF